MGHPNHLDGSVDKGDEFIDSGMTLITEVESEKYLKMSEKRKNVKKQQADEGFFDTTETFID
jgi:hypothetical protein